MEYRHITTGVIVNSDSELPSAVYEPVDKPGKKEAAKRATRKTAAKKKEQ